MSAGAHARRAVLHLVDDRGRPLGALAPYDVAVPWWQETGVVVEAARVRDGVDVRVLHLLAGTPADEGHPTCGGEVHYLAEVVGASAEQRPRHLVRPERATEPEPDEPLRPLWARPGGTARVLAWADAQLAALGRRRAGPPVQVRVWNLSSILRLDTAAGPVWAKGALGSAG